MSYTNEAYLLSTVSMLSLSLQLLILSPFRLEGGEQDRLLISGCGIPAP